MKQRVSGTGWTLGRPLDEVRIFQQLSLGFFTLCVFGGVFFFSLISNKEEMNVCGNWRGRANSSAVPCHSQSCPCVSSSRRVTCLISRQSWDARETRVSFLVIQLLKRLWRFYFSLPPQNSFRLAMYSSKKMCFICLCSASPRLHYHSLSHSLFFSLSPSLPLSPSPLNPSASCRSVRLPVSVPIRFHLIHVTSINTQSSPDKSRPLSPPLCLSCVALHHSVFPNKLSSPQSLHIKSHADCTSR